MFTETDMIEFKREFSKTIVKTIVAFANTKGGVLYLGIEDDGHICGLENPDATMLSVMNVVRDSIKPSAEMVVQCEQVEMHGKQVVGVRVERGANRPYYLAGKGMRPEGVYVRQGSGSYMASEIEIANMLKETQRDSFEERRCVHQALTFSQTEAAFKAHDEAFGEAQMHSLGLIDGDSQFTNLGWMLSDQCDAPLKLAVFFGTKRTTFKDRMETSGSLLAQFDQALDFLEKYMHYQTRFVNMRRVDYDNFPPDAVREGLLNALVHRDYDIAAPTLVSILEDRLEITSHGGLPPSVSLDEFQMDVSVPRNPRLAAVFYRLGLIEAYGTGIVRMFEAYEGSGKSPIFDITKRVFKVTLPNRNYEGEVTSRSFAHKNGQLFDAGDGEVDVLAAETNELRNQERLVLEMLEDQGPLKRSEIQQRFDFSQATLLRILKRLEDQGRIRAEGNTRRRVYRALF